MARKKRQVMSEQQYRKLGHAHKAGGHKQLHQLRQQYEAAKALRAKAGSAWRKNKSKGNYEVYKEAEAAWQATGMKLGQVSGTHAKRRKWRKGTEKNVTQIFSYGSFKTAAARSKRKKKHTKTSRRR